MLAFKPSTAIPMPPLWIVVAARLCGSAKLGVAATKTGVGVAEPLITPADIPQLNMLPPLAFTTTVVVEPSARPFVPTLLRVPAP